MDVSFTEKRKAKMLAELSGSVDPAGWLGGEGESRALGWHV